jgi:D-arabinose 1-dehydrogenase-like Zn-dependent alcohol dehydrogenase
VKTYDDVHFFVLDKHNITADVEVIPIQKVNEAYKRLSNADVNYRFSIDMTSLKSQLMVLVSYEL